MPVFCRYIKTKRETNIDKRAFNCSKFLTWKNENLSPKIDNKMGMPIFTTSTQQFTGNSNQSN